MSVLALAISFRLSGISVTVVSRTCVLQPSILSFSNSKFTSAFSTQHSALRKHPHLPAGVPEEHRLGFLKDFAADLGDQSGHRLGRIGRIEEERFSSRDELDRLDQ